MQRLLYLVSMPLILGGLFFTRGVLADHSSDQYSFVSAITSVERVGKKPIRTKITWLESLAAENGDVTLDHFEVVVLKEDTEVGRISVALDQRNVEINKKKISGMKVFTLYDVRVDEIYVDGTSSEGFEESLYTGPPKLENLKVVKKEIDDEGDMTITVKWIQPTNVKGEYVYYDYKLANVGEPDEIIDEGYDFGDLNKITIEDLPAKKMQIRVRVRDSNYGNGQWSSWKVFNAPKKD